MPLVNTPVNLAPPGAVIEQLRAVDAVRLRAVRWRPQRPKRGTVAIFGGRGEFIEKYFETIGELIERGFAVVALDWRGQGGSERQLKDARKGHIDDFSLYERDLNALVVDVLGPFCPRPWYALANSMGAAILLMIAQAGRAPFDRMVLLSPMIDIAGLKRPTLARLIIATADFVGLGGSFVPGARRGPTGLQPFAGNPLTSDPVRFARLGSTLRADPTLGVGWPTVGWLNAAFRLMRQFQDPDFPRSIMTPTLVIAAGQDRVADTRASERFAERLRAGHLIVIDGAEHEILMERDAFRDQFWAAFDAYVSAAEPEREP